MKCPRGKPRGHIYHYETKGEFYFKKRIAFHFKLSRSGSISSAQRISSEAATLQSCKEVFAMTNNIISDLSMEFAISIVNLCDSIKGRSAIVNQLLRSGTSIGANIREANYGQSKADFVAKMQIALKECFESEYWLELFSKTNIISGDVYVKLKNDCGKIRRMLIASINTTKERYNL